MSGRPFYGAGIFQGTTHISILGYESHLLEYKEGFGANLRFHDTNVGLLVSAVNGAL